MGQHSDGTLANLSFGHLLQELVAANSSLKAALQQRDHALADKEALLEQQGHDLACSESLLQEMHERLATREREHCDAMWAKGQVAGLLELNEHLQLQLEQQGQELQELKAALERWGRTVCGDVGFAGVLS